MPDACNLRYLRFDFELYWVAIHKEIPTFMCTKIQTAKNWDTSENVVLKRKTQNMIQYAEGSLSFSYIYINFQI